MKIVANILCEPEKIKSFEEYYVTSCYLNNTSQFITIFAFVSFLFLVSKAIWYI